MPEVSRKSFPLAHFEELWNMLSVLLFLWLMEASSSHLVPPGTRTEAPGTGPLGRRSAGLASRTEALGWWADSLFDLASPGPKTEAPGELRAPTKGFFDLGLPNRVTKAPSMEMPGFEGLRTKDQQAFPDRTEALYLKLEEKTEAPYLKLEEKTEAPYLKLEGLYERTGRPVRKTEWPAKITEGPGTEGPGRRTEANPILPGQTSERPSTQARSRKTKSQRTVTHGKGTEGGSQGSEGGSKGTEGGSKGTPTEWPLRGSESHSALPRTVTEAPYLKTEGLTKSPSTRAPSSEGPLSSSLPGW